MRAAWLVGAHLSSLFLSLLLDSRFDRSFSIFSLCISLSVITTPAPNEQAWFVQCTQVNAASFPVAALAAVPPVAAGPPVDLDFTRVEVRFPFQKVRTRMYLRHCWSFFVRVLVNGFAQLDPADPNHQPIRPTQHWVVTGSPGIGTNSNTLSMSRLVCACC